MQIFFLIRLSLFQCCIPLSFLDITSSFIDYLYYNIRLASYSMYVVILSNLMMLHDATRCYIYDNYFI